MSAARTIWANDLRNIVRDRTVGVLLVVPVIFLVLLRFGYPLAQRYVPQAGEYAHLVVAGFCLIAGTFPAFMTSFIMLDERDQGVFAALRVLPIALGRLLAYRLSVVTALSLIYPALRLAGTGLVDLPLWRQAVLVVLCAIGSPAATMLVVAVAGNKIEGLTLFKGLFFVLALAGAAVAQPGWWIWLVALLPMYWVYAAFDAVTTAGFLAAAAVALGYHLIVIAVAWRRLRHGVF
jgi:fluoroquinolone transport system permease protein